MHPTVRNALVVGGCALAVTLADVAEEIAQRDVTSPAVTYASGTVTVQSQSGYVQAPPQAPVDAMPVRVIASYPLRASEM